MYFPSICRENLTSEQKAVKISLSKHYRNKAMKGKSKSGNPPRERDQVKARRTSRPNMAPEPDDENRFVC